MDGSTGRTALVTHGSTMFWRRRGLVGRGHHILPGIKLEFAGGEKYGSFFENQGHEESSLGVEEGVLKHIT